MNSQQPRIAVVGVGHELRGDDAAGIAVVRSLQSSANKQVCFIDAGAAPENFTSVLRDFVPDLVLVVDAVQMNQPPGTICLFDLADVENNSPMTHTLSFHLFVAYLETELRCSVKLLGIQAGQDAFGAELSRAVGQSVHTVVCVLQSIHQNGWNSSVSLDG